MTRQEFIDGLRWTADFYQQHPEIGHPGYLIVNNHWPRTREQLSTIARAIGHCEKRGYESVFYLRKTLNPDFHLDFVAPRNEVCERVVVGTRIVPAKPATTETVEEIVEWKCGSVLAPQESEVA